ncbi:hypothetical protein ElyMa_005197400 [Elysia marginata]|uniref:STI1/HOP DP domain-containing protein n=1 Tax=Elysia marginata TaxID=1093978 RepID=A0AAV4JV56_9GAST|nr:hypothetical protein ElyMa_005197400 [Elysia marginata]
MLNADRLKMLQMQAPSCTQSGNEEVQQKIMKIIMTQVDENCEPIKKSQSKPKKVDPTPPLETNLDTDNTTSSVNDTSSVPGDEGDADVPAVDTKPEEPPKPGPTMMVPDFSKIKTHPMWDTLVNMAQSAFQLDLEKIAAMSKEEQIQEMKTMPPDMAAKLPALKALLGENADDYFYSVPKPQSRKRRQAEDGATTSVPSSVNTTVAAPAEKTESVTKPSKNELSEKEKKPKLYLAYGLLFVLVKLIVLIVVVVEVVVVVAVVVVVVVVVVVLVVVLVVVEVVVAVVAA